MFNKLYQILNGYYPIRRWWPGNCALEIVIGTILTQNASWKGVEKAIQRIKDARCLGLTELLELPDEELAEIIRPCGYANLKTRRLKNLLTFIQTHYGTVEGMADVPLERLREELLSVNGVGRETADSILLYALRKPSFVIDAYTRRVLSRHEMMGEKTPYDEMRAAFQKTIPHDVALYAHYHAMIVELCKEFCVKNHPKCDQCPLAGWKPDREN